MRGGTRSVSLREQLQRALRHDARVAHEHAYTSQLVALLQCYATSLDDTTMRSGNNSSSSSEDGVATAAAADAPCALAQQSQAPQHVLEAATRLMHTARTHDVDVHSMLATLTQQLCATLVPLTPRDVVDTRTTTAMVRVACVYDCDDGKASDAQQVQPDAQKSSNSSSIGSSHRHVHREGHTMFASVYDKWSVALALLRRWRVQCVLHKCSSEQGHACNADDTDNKLRADDDVDDVYALATLDVMTCMLAQLQSWWSSLSSQQQQQQEEEEENGGVRTRAAPPPAVRACALPTSTRRDADEDDCSATPLALVVERLTDAHVLHGSSAASCGSPGRRCLALLSHIAWWCDVFAHAPSHDAMTSSNSSGNDNDARVTMRRTLTMTSVHLFRAVLQYGVVLPTSRVLGELLVRVLAYTHATATTATVTTYAQTLAALDAGVLHVCMWCRRILALPYHTDSGAAHARVQAWCADAAASAASASAAACVAASDTTATSSGCTLGDVVCVTIAQLALSRLADVVAAHADMHTLLHDGSDTHNGDDNRAKDDVDAQTTHTATAAAAAAAPHHTAAQSPPRMSRRLCDALDTLTHHVNVSALQRDGNYATLRRLCAS